LEEKEEEKSGVRDTCLTSSLAMVKNDKTPVLDTSMFRISVHA
jgi:hypothetical protein